MRATVQREVQALVAWKAMIVWTPSTASGLTRLGCSSKSPTTSAAAEVEYEDRDACKHGRLLSLCSQSVETTVKAKGFV